MTSRSAGTALRIAALLGPLAVGACAVGGDASADAGAPVVVTFEVVDERFKVLLTDPADILHARRLLAGEDIPSIPNGRVIRESRVNEGFSWSLDPNDIDFADVTIEVCDGLPSDVETGSISGDRYCPWSAVVIGIEPAG